MEDKKQDRTKEDPQPDLKHDSMDFAASAEGDDRLDFDDNSYEEEEISADELDMLEPGDYNEMAAALNSAETDRLADEDNLPEENWTEDLPDNDPAKPHYPGNRKK